MCISLFKVNELDIFIHFVGNLQIWILILNIKIGRKDILLEKRIDAHIHTLLALKYGNFHEEINGRGI